MYTYTYISPNSLICRFTEQSSQFLKFAVYCSFFFFFFYTKVIWILHDWWIFIKLTNQWSFFFLLFLNDIHSSLKFVPAQTCIRVSFNGAVWVTSYLECSEDNWRVTDGKKKTKTKQKHKPQRSTRSHALKLHPCPAINSICQTATNCKSSTAEPRRRSNLRPGSKLAGPASLSQPRLCCQRQQPAHSQGQNDAEQLWLLQRGGLAAQALFFAGCSHERCSYDRRVSRRSGAQPITTSGR